MRYNEFSNWISRRRFLTQAAIGGAGLGAAALIGCGDDDDDDAAPTATAPPAATEAATAAPAATVTPTPEAAAPSGPKSGGFLRYITPPRAFPPRTSIRTTPTGQSAICCSASSSTSR